MDVVYVSNQVVVVIQVEVVLDSVGVEIAGPDELIDPPIVVVVLVVRPPA